MQAGVSFGAVLADAGYGISGPFRQALSALGLLIFFYGLVTAFMRKEKAADNPWGPGATTLEWTLSSPPPFHQFEVLPKIK
jgi:cytochrome c oxidase subunit 1